MKREIKFRGKRTDTGEWIYGNLFIPNQLISGVYICPAATFGDFLPGFEDGDNIDGYKNKGIAIGHFFEVHEESVGEFTGLLDKNGKEIYEGDILRSGNREGISFVVWCLDGWRFNSWMPESMDLYPHVDKTRGREIAEVIGNIYENSELLKS